jgi:uncharacterized membrane protein HdeD (DUF308 family)
MDKPERRTLSEAHIYNERARVLRQGFATFLAGVYHFVTVFQMSSVTGTAAIAHIESIKWLTAVIGALLIAGAFIISTAAFAVNDRYRHWILRWEETLLPPLYTISITQLLSNIATFYEHTTTLLVVSGIFLVMAMAAIMLLVTSRKVLGHIPTLLLGSLTFFLLAVLMLWVDPSIWLISSYIVIGVLLLARAVFVYRWRPRKRQTDIKN